MNPLLQIPDWLGTALVGAVLAALGYVFKLFIELYQSFQERQRTKRARLIELQSLLRATNVAFTIQKKHAINLTHWIKTNRPEVLQKLTGYEGIIAGAFNHLNPEGKELHSIIRSITVNALYPANKAVLEWLRDDTVFKATKSKDPVFSKLAAELATMDSHLALWMAKYEAWIPLHPEHALVYMADEEDHGLGFPKGIDKLVEGAVNRF